MNANGPWTATTDASWIWLDETIGIGGSTVKVAVAANTSSNERTGRIIFACDTAMQTVTITQEKQASPFNVVLKAPSWNPSLNDRAVPVYSGPGTNYYRAANGKAECTTRDGFYLWGCVNVNGTNWYMITYETAYPMNRTGYIKQGSFNGTLEADALKFASEVARTTRDVGLTDDPFGAQSCLFTLKKGTDVTYLGTYTNNGEAWYYIECVYVGKTVRGFIPAETLELK